MARSVKRPGRPVAGKSPKDAREALISAASELFGAHGPEGVSVRQVAEAAGVSPAMIHYYFKDKRGLMRAVLERGLDRMLNIITEVVADREGRVTGNFIDRYVHALAAEPSLPQLMIREVLSGKSPYQRVIAERFVQKAAALMPARLAADIDEGRLRGDLDPRLTMVSLIGMCVFPFIAAPLLGPVLGIESVNEYADTLVAHTTKLFNEGAVP